MEHYRVAAELTPSELWWAYFALGGNRTPDAVAAIVEGRAHPDRTDHDLLALALNERFSELGRDSRVPFFDQLEA